MFSAVLAVAFSFAAADSRAAAEDDVCRRRVLLDGKEIGTWMCRVSAMPFNRIWTGVQRPVDQARDAVVASFDLVAPGTVEVLGYPSECSPILFPLSESNRLTRTQAGFAVHLDRPAQYVIDFGPTAPPLHLFADPPFRRSHAAGEMYFGPGEHDAGVISPTNGQTVVIDRGAVVKGAIFLDHVTNVTVMGRGVLDCSDLARADPLLVEYRRARGYKLYDAGFGCHACVICGSENVRFEGFVIQDTPLWALVVRSGSRNVVIDNVKIVGQWRYNSDGIDVSASSDVVVKNCFVRSFDDCLVVLGAYLDKTCNRTERVRFENCRLWCDWGASFKLWSPSGSNIYRDILVRNCKLLHSFQSPLHVRDSVGGADTRIENVRLEGLELDFLAPPLAGILQKKDDMRYPGDRRASTLALATVACLWPKDDFGNQKFVRVKDPAKYRSSISNVTFENFSFYGEVPPLVASIMTEAPNQIVSNVTFRGMPPVSVKTRGNVVGVRQLETCSPMPFRLGETRLFKMGE